MRVFISRFLAIAVFAAAGAFGSAQALAQKVLFNDEWNRALAAAPGTTVVDANGNVVGTLLGPNMVEFQVGSKEWVATPVTNFTFGVENGGIDARIDYTSSNCTGTGYLAVSGLPPGVVTTDTISPYTMYFPSPPFQSIPIASYINRPYSEACIVLSQPSQQYVGQMGSVTLKFTAPFSVK